MTFMIRWLRQCWDDISHPAKLRHFRHLRDGRSRRAVWCPICKKAFVPLAAEGRGVLDMQQWMLVPE